MSRSITIREAEAKMPYPWMAWDGIDEMTWDASGWFGIGTGQYCVLWYGIVLVCNGMVWCANIGP